MIPATDCEKSQLYLHHQMLHFPAAGEIVVFDLSWHNRAGVGHVLGFCTGAAPPVPVPYERVKRVEVKPVDRSSKNAQATRARPRRTKSK
jgi:polyphosphate kinase 2 (PPK2 family)